MKSILTPGPDSFQPLYYQVGNALQVQPAAGLHGLPAAVGKEIAVRQADALEGQELTAIGQHLGYRLQPQ